MAETLPEVVYHYTGIAAMMGIVESGSIWATSICYLNDVTEEEHFLGMLRRLLPDFLSRNNVTQAHKNALDILNDDSPLPFEARPFVASFSKHGDSLPQWRSYCANGNGVAIGFRVDCLKRAAIKDVPNEVIFPNPSFLQVKYLDAGMVESADETFENLLKAVDQLSNPNPAWQGTGGFWCHYLASRQACEFKHYSFKNEAEFRLVSEGVDDRVKLLHFRTVRSTMVPYLEFEIPLWHSGYSHNLSDEELAGRWQFIDRVVIGPTPNMELSCRAVEAFFRSKELNVEVVPSAIPFREW
jgi:hypothetical protein